MKRFTYLSVSTLIILLLSSSLLLHPVLSQIEGFSWPYSSFDENASRFNPQVDINKEDIMMVEQQWMMPLEFVPPMFSPNMTLKTVGHPIIQRGILYYLTRSPAILAIRLDDGTSFWSLPLAQPNQEKFGLHEENIHNHFLNYYDNKLWLVDKDCTIKAIDDVNGELIVEIPSDVLCGTIPPNAEPRDTYFRGITAPILYREEGIMIVAPSGFETTERSISYIVGISVDSEEVVWKTSLTKDGGNVVLGWGQWAIDQEEGIIYIGTGSPTPEWFASDRPEEDPYSNSIIALDASTGEIVWNYQAIPNDLNGYGCTSNVILGEIENKKTVYAACRNGYLYALDAETGDLLWYFDPPTVKRVNSGNADYVKTGIFDTKPWANHPSTDPFLQCPGALGAVSNYIVLAYDTIYMSTFNSCSIVEIAPTSNIGDTGVVDFSKLLEAEGSVNSTLYAVDATSGEEKWSNFFDEEALTGGLTVSGGLVFVPAPDGTLYTYDANDGSAIWDRSFGVSGLSIPTVLGATARGNFTMVQFVGGSAIIGNEVGVRSAYLLAFSIPSENIVVLSTSVEDTIGEGISLSTNYIIIGIAVSLIGAFAIFTLVGRKK